MISFRSASTRAHAAIAGAAVVVIASWASPARAQCEDQKLLPRSGAMFDRFGTAIAMSGNVLVIGEQNDDTVSTNSGAVYVYRFDGATWNFEAELFASDAGFGQNFGSSVATDGDTMVVGSLGANSATGAAYVFRFDGATWLPRNSLHDQARINGPDEHRFSLTFWYRIGYKRTGRRDGNGRVAAILGRIRDWGCSSGRVLRFWADLAATTEVWECDIDEDAMDWAVRHLAPPFRFFSTTLAPSIPVADRSFDLV